MKSKINEIEVFFFTDTCYRCGKEYGLYSVEKIITEDNQELKATPSIDYSDDDLMYDADVVRLVRLYLEDHPELKCEIGQVKKRYSNSVGSSYISFGCPDCDALVGKFHILENYMECSVFVRDNTVRIKADDYIGRKAPVVTPRFSCASTAPQNTSTTHQLFNNQMFFKQPVSNPGFYRYVFPISEIDYIANDNVIKGERYSDNSIVELDIIGDNFNNHNAKEIGFSYILKNDIPCKQCFSCLYRKSEACLKIIKHLLPMSKCDRFTKDVEYVDGLSGVPEGVTVNRIV